MSEIAARMRCAGRSEDLLRLNGHRPCEPSPPLFFSVLFGVCLHRFFRMRSGVNRMAHRRLSVMRRLLVVSRLVLLGRLLVMSRGVGMMFGSFLVMLIPPPYRVESE